MELKHVEIFTDGACRGNPGPGGYGVILRFNGQEKELSGGYSKTTNNRMELLAAVTGLAALKEKCRVTLYSDSQYLINGIEKGWAKKWRANGWVKSDKKPALNADLWDRLLNLIESHDVEMIWVKGHDGHPENERCDSLAVEAALKSAGDGTSF
ncbi:MAG TPA: ribonuclease HI [Ruminiclostridium sp.]|jgi:ribonuclease HI|nr:ribonuclease HI [Ruminiclostridium sp.]